MAKKTTNKTKKTDWYYQNDKYDREYDEIENTRLTSKEEKTFMTKAEKVEIIRSLDKKGVFDVKGSPELVAGMLGTSVFTIYNYIKEVRNEYK